jgi:hypothetical protein
MIESKKSTNIWARHVAQMEEKRNAFKVLVGKSEGKRLLEIPGRRW